MMSEIVEVVSTFPSKEDAERMAQLLVEESLAACVQIQGPIESIYRWKGKVEKDKEWLLTAKTKRTLYKEVESLIKENHPYEVPQILALPVVDGFKGYLTWLKGEVR
ncbi:divalent-cation tolerance protein CutA [Thermovibrio sp.]